MYRKNDGQISIAEFLSPFGKLDETNRWVKKAKLIPWDRIEETYARLFESDTGNVAKPVRMALGSLLIKQETGLSDEGVVQNIVENPYMQFFIGLHEFTTKASFAATTMVYFRKRLTAEILAEINEIIFAAERDEEDGSGSGSGGPGGDTPETSDGGGAEGMEGQVQNQGILMLDATCVPADITYPTDVGLLNEAREKLEDIIDLLHPQMGEKRKPRTYRKRARKDYLNFVKRRKKGKRLIRKAIRKQLGYVRRDLSHIGKMLENASDHPLPERHTLWLSTIRTLYEQQLFMYRNRTHTVPDRIVSISQPHVRPMVRGKKAANVEFGAKVSISLVDGYAFVDKIGWDNYSEAELLPDAVERYRRRYGHYPEAVLADKLYRNRNNLRYCKDRGIRLSGPRLGRPPKDVVHDLHERSDNAMRNWVESKFGEGKTGYGLARLFARLKGTSEAAIQLAFLALNLSRRVRELFRCLFLWLESVFLFFMPLVE